MIAHVMLLGSEAAGGGLTVAGWVMLIGSVGMVLSLCCYCAYRALTEPHAEEHMHAPLDIDTHDLND